MYITKKKVALFILILALVFSNSLSVFAEGTADITDDNKGYIEMEFYNPASYVVTLPTLIVLCDDVNQNVPVKVRGDIGSLNGLSVTAPESITMAPTEGSDNFKKLRSFKLELGNRVQKYHGNDLGDGTVTLTQNYTADLDYGKINKGHFHGMGEFTIDIFDDSVEMPSANSMDGDLHAPVRSTCKKISYVSEDPNLASATSVFYKGNEWKMAWYDGTKELVISSEDNKRFAAKELLGYFNNYTSLESIDFSNVDFSPCTTIQAAFVGCTSLKSVDFSKAVFTNLENMDGTFLNCTSLQSVTFSAKNNITKLKSMSGTFQYCQSLKSINGIDTMDTSNLEDLTNAFNSTGLESLDLSAWDTSSLEICGGTFTNSTQLSSLNISTWTAENLNIMDSMFACTALTNLDLTAMKAVPKRVNCMCGNMQSLTEIKMPNLNFSIASSPIIDGTVTQTITGTAHESFFVNTNVAKPDNLQLTQAS